MQNRKYVFIGGTTKAGTTSLFSYLADHPGICPSSVKETGFFLDEDYPFAFERKVYYKDGFNRFDLFFPSCNEQTIRLEATATYLYSRGTPFRIKEALGNCKWIFILREQISRLISVYRFFKQMNRIPEEISFEEFVTKQIELGEYAGSRGVITGLYSRYLRDYFKVFSKENILILKYDEFFKNPQKNIIQVCEFLEIDPSYYERYSFGKLNKTWSVRNRWLQSIYIRASKLISHRHFLAKPKLQSMVKRMRSVIEPIYIKINSKSDDEITIPDELRKIIKEYYADEENALAELLGVNEFRWTPDV